MVKIELKKISKSFGKVVVLKDISFVFEEGEFIVLIGPSGCGKSTLLRMVAGLEDPTSGEILIDGKVANRVPAKQRDLAMVFQSYALYPHMNVAKNMSLALKLAKIPKPEIEQRVAEAADILGLSELLERLPRELSGGQRQRVAMGRAIVRNPKAFLFDEPLSNLDAKLRVKMRSEIKKLHRDLGKTMIYVTHDQTEAMTLADKVVVLNDGVIAQMGAPLDVYQNPNSTFVASFIGTPEINLIEVTSMGENSDVVALSQGVELPMNKSININKGTKVIYGIRPQHIDIVEVGITAQVEIVEPTGEDQSLTLRVGDQKIVVVARDKQSFEVGQQIQIMPKSHKIILFDSKTGSRIL
ncbi:MAG: sn-glycerol-3-phosphate ABC transporter ATP-binding protein UgpC [Rhizobiales bacterium]|nr:sn-glycerol-3-phosphate ABC transporter ATP-binding protein UgpC [Hyphomicrobiales bacterium]NRB13878.1 sn-glycerol-3-phosphate ABC transporter ATP-binding protein UgpC [Hyphomicrobiales bacterium]